MLAACASAAPPTPVTHPAAQTSVLDSPAIDLRGDPDALVLALSGGGARAAAFSLGALQALRETRAADGRSLLDHVQLITSVSGGSVLAAYFGEHGQEGLDTFRGAYIDKNWDRVLHTSPYAPMNWARAARGGLNGPTIFADWLDREVYDHRTLDALGANGAPQIWINATDLPNGVPFAFTPLYFNALCADLGTVRIADAVAASMAVPVAFQPVLAEPYPEHCAPQPSWQNEALTSHAAPALVRRTAAAFAAYRDPARLRYLHLVDGGVIDNLGLSTLALARLVTNTPYAPLSESDAIRMRGLTFLVVNSEKIEPTQFQMRPRSPTGAEMAGRLFDMQIETGNRSSYDAFRMLAADWERALREWRCGLSAADVARLRGNTDGWACGDVHIVVDMISFSDLPEPQRSRLGAAPTRVTLPRPLTDALIEGGQEAVRQNETVRSLTR